MSHPNPDVSIYSKNIGYPGIIPLQCFGHDNNSKIRKLQSYIDSFKISFIRIYLDYYWRDLLKYVMGSFNDGRPIYACWICNFSLRKTSLLICLDFNASLRYEIVEDKIFSGQETHTDDLSNTQPSISLLVSNYPLCDFSLFSDMMPPPWVLQYRRTFQCGCWFLYPRIISWLGRG